MKATGTTVGGKPVYSATFTADYEKANAVQFQSWDKDEWKHQTPVNKGVKTELAELDGKLVKASDDENVNGEIVEFKPDDTSETTVPETTVSETTVPELKQQYPKQQYLRPQYLPRRTQLSSQTTRAGVRYISTRG